MFYRDVISILLGTLNFAAQCRELRLVMPTGANKSFFLFHLVNLPQHLLQNKGTFLYQHVTFP